MYLRVFKYMESYKIEKMIELKSSRIIIAEIVWMYAKCVCEMQHGSETSGICLKIHTQRCTTCKGRRTNIEESTDTEQTSELDWKVHIEKFRGVYFEYFIEMWNEKNLHYFKNGTNCSRLVEISSFQSYNCSILKKKF